MVYNIIERIISNNRYLLLFYYNGGLRMKVKISKYLLNQKSYIQKLVQTLSRDYKYVSILGSDVKGKRYTIQKTSVNISDSMWTERGFVLRIHNGRNYTEFSFNDLSKYKVELLIDKINSTLENLQDKDNLSLNTYPVINEEEINDSFFAEVKILPEEINIQDKLDRLISIKDNALDYSDYIVDFKLIYEEVEVSKIFISNRKNLEQSYIWSQSNLVPILREEDNTIYYNQGFSGLKGVELIDEIESSYQDVISTSEKLLDAKQIEPGTYDVICSPDIAGLIAHEAFGHGVEMDMFVKNRAKAVEYINKKVASELVTLHDGAKAARHVSSYFFDDEGELASDTIIIDRGILKTGISDLLSSLRLETKASGNGKRESFERKAYSRMTNTFFAAGNDRLEDMIKSIKFGYLLDGTMSGMEDPKNWGIQCMVFMGKEIRDGKLSGNIVSPVIITGYVPDLLKSITMVSENIELSGTGACGKGYKEWVKVSSGGPYIKTRARLG
jgi:TldD protein